MKLFIVDDEKAVRDYIVSLTAWNSLGCKIVGQAADGWEAYETISGTKVDAPDVLITDIRMPYMDGIELTRRILEDFPDMKVIFLTAHGEFEYAKQAVKLGAADFITKPFHENELVDRVKWIRDHRLDRRRPEWVQQEEWIRALLTPLMPEREKLDSLGHPEAMNQPAVFLFVEIDNSGILDDTGKPFSNLALREIIADVMTLYPHPYWSALSQSGVYLVLFIPPAVPKEQLAHEAMEIARHILDAIHGSLGFSVSIGISELLSSAAELRRGLEEAKSCLDYRMLIGRNSIVAYSSMLSMQEQKREQSELKRSELADLLRKGDEALISDYLRTMNRTFMLEGISKTRIQEACMEMVETAGQTLHSFGIQPSPEETIAVRKSVLSFTILSDLMTYMEQFLKRTTALVGSARQSTSANYIDAAIKFIESRYMEDITLQMLADELFVNYSYLSRLIKKETGRNFRDLLWEHRIDIAKTKLATTNLKHYEVAYAVGFKDAAHFSQLFKKMTGKTPKDYKA
ncbi:response regulator [Paenibacillus sp. GCM10027626]|uniref:response regulator n=1 Tax=Paenibacillus sp. GCM10027626 TaxID=3273411 RepID=UPI00363564A6